MRDFGVGFLKEIFKHGSIFHAKIPNYGSDFQTLKICSVFVAKLQEMGTFFLMLLD